MNTLQYMYNCMTFPINHYKMAEQYKMADKVHSYPNLNSIRGCKNKNKSDSFPLWIGNREVAAIVKQKGR